MIITCPNCSKKFELNNQLIPNNGRLLQCGNCDHKWFYKKVTNINENILIKKTKPIKIPSSKPAKKFNENNEIINNKYNEKKQKEKELKKDKNNTNFFKLLIVAIISITALLLIVDTFKTQISLIIPNINEILSNLYETLVDLKLFFVDLIK